MKNLFFVFFHVVPPAFCFVFSSGVFSQQSGRIQGFMALTRSQRPLKIYYDYIQPANGSPVFIFFPGLTHDSTHSEGLAQSLSAKGYGVLRFDPRGMGQTLLHPSNQRISEPISALDQVADARELFEKLEIPKPFHIAGLSYGGGLAILFGSLYPELVKELFLMAPYTEPLEAQDRTIKSLIASSHVNPFLANGKADDQLYRLFLEGIIFATYPIFEPEAVSLGFEKLRAIALLVEGIRKIDILSYLRRLPPESVALFIAQHDEYIPKIVLKRLWDSIPSSTRLAKVTIQDIGHKMPQNNPDLMARLIHFIHSNRRVVGSEGRDFIVYPSRNPDNITLMPQNGFIDPIPTNTSIHDESSLITGSLKCLSLL